MKGLFLFFIGLIILLSCQQKKEGKVEQYVSITCEKGDMTLILNPNKKFDLTILIWDEATKSQTGKETIKGKWSKGDSTLTLNSSDKNVIVYHQTVTQMKIMEKPVSVFTYSFKSNAKNFFGSKYDLLEKEKTDSFLLEQAKAYKEQT